MVILPAWMRIIISSGLCFVAGGIAALYITINTASWYASLERPIFFDMPLPVMFFVAIVSYALMSIASSLMWIHDPKPWDFRGWVPLFFTHLLVNCAWVILFFGYNVVFVALLVALLLATFAILLTAGAWERSRLAFWILIPYLAWTLYILGMNIAVWFSN